jgi:hypothetical protein
LFKKRGEVVNSIVYYNTCVNGSNYYCDTGYGYFTNCCTAPLIANDSQNTNNIVGPPSFVSPLSDYHLAQGSPCINAGVNCNWMDSTTDLDGHHRLDTFSGIVDMGCYEYLFSGMMVTFP